MSGAPVGKKQTEKLKEQNLEPLKSPPIIPIQCCFRLTRNLSIKNEE
jgi:hypothetical protein